LVDQLAGGYRSNCDREEPQRVPGPALATPEGEDRDDDGEQPEAATEEAEDVELPRKEARNLGFLQRELLPCTAGELRLFAGRG
jgi:hypothetical protein